MSCMSCIFENLMKLGRMKDKERKPVPEIGPWFLQRNYPTGKTTGCMLSYEIWRERAEKAEFAVADLILSNPEWVPDKTELDAIARHCAGGDSQPQNMNPACLIYNIDTNDSKYSFEYSTNDKQITEKYLSYLNDNANRIWTVMQAAGYNLPDEARPVSFFEQTETLKKAILHWQELTVVIGPDPRWAAKNILKSAWINLLHEMPDDAFAPFRNIILRLISRASLRKSGLALEWEIITQSPEMLQVTRKNGSEDLYFTDILKTIRD